MSIKPQESFIAWPEQAAVVRVDGCRTVLYVHGFLSAAENERVARRIDKWAARAGVYREGEQPKENEK